MIYIFIAPHSELFSMIHEGGSVASNGVLKSHHNYYYTSRMLSICGASVRKAVFSYLLVNRTKMKSRRRSGTKASLSSLFSIYPLSEDCYSILPLFCCSDTRCWLCWHKISCFIDSVVSGDHGRSMVEHMYFRAGISFPTLECISLTLLIS